MGRGQAGTGIFIVWLFALISSVIFIGYSVARGPLLESNVSALLPTFVATPSVANSSEQLRELAERRFMLVVASPSVDIDRLAQELITQLKAVEGITLVDGRDFYSKLQQQIRPYRHQLLSFSQRQYLTDHDPKAIAQNALAQLYDPVQQRLFPFAEDPFNLASGFLIDAMGTTAGVSASGFPVVSSGGKEWIVITARLLASPYDIGIQQRLNFALSEFEAAHSDAALLRSGLIFHAAKGAQIARTEISTLGAISLLATLAVVVFLFRSFSSVLLIGLTLLSASIVAFAATLAIFDSVHLITLAFGATLLGIAVDYCFHFLTKYKQLGEPDAVRKLLRRSFLISALTTSTAYLVQLLSPFTGLHQFAVFVASGILFSSLTVFVGSRWLPRREPTDNAGVQFFQKSVAPLVDYLVLHRKGLLVLVLMVLGAACAILITRGSSDDIRQLNTSSDSMLAQERRIQELLKIPSLSQFIVVTGADVEQVLVRTEEIVVGIDEQTAERLNATNTVAALLPSEAQQRSDRQLVEEKLYGPNGAMAQLCRLLESDCSWVASPGAYDRAFGLSDLPAEIIEISPGFALLKNNLAVLFLPQDIDRRLISDLVDKDSVYYVDQVELLTQKMRHFRIQVSWLLGAFIILVALVGINNYAKKGLLMPCVIVLSGAIALLFSAPQGISLFHVLALLLVAGIAIDTLVVYFEVGFNHATWLAATSAALTSMAVFGMLGLSRVALLEQFGTTVFWGLFTAWVLAAVFAGPVVRHQESEHLGNIGHERNSG